MRTNEQRSNNKLELNMNKNITKKERTNVTYRTTTHLTHTEGNRKQWRSQAESRTDECGVGKKRKNHIDINQSRKTKNK